jgi:seryl-tRNA synthetase
MIDPKLLRANLDDVAHQLARRGYRLDTQALAALEEKRKKVQVIAQQFQSERNAKSKAIGAAKSKGEDTSRLMQEVAQIGAAQKQAETSSSRSRTISMKSRWASPTFRMPAFRTGKTRTQTRKSGAGANRKNSISRRRTTSIWARRWA